MTHLLNLYFEMPQANITKSEYNAFANDPINVIDPDGKDIIKIVRITTIYPARASGLDGGRPIGGGVTQGISYQIIKAPGKDVFFYNTVDVHLSANSGNDKIVAGKPKEFFPNDFQLFGTGITQSDGNIYPLQRVNDIDRITLAKLVPPGLVEALEKKDANKYGDLRLLSATLAIGEGGRELAGNLLLLEGGFEYLAEKTEQAALLKPYGGTGGGHHIPAKSAFKGAVGYDANAVLAIPNAEMARLGIDHGVVSGAQQVLYRAFAATGEKISWGAVRNIEIKALIKGGASSKGAQATVDKAIGALKASGISGPTRIPWGPK